MSTGGPAVLRAPACEQPRCDLPSCVTSTPRYVMPQLPRWAGCAVGAVAIALATLVRFALSATLGENSPFLVYTVPVLAAAAVGGCAPG